MSTAIAWVYNFVATYWYTFKYIAMIALNIAVQKLFAPKFPTGALSGHQSMSYSALEYRKIVYGQSMVSGPVTYHNVSGDDNEYLWYQVALVHGQSDSFISIWFDGDEIPVADITWTPGTDTADGAGNGGVSTTKWVNSDNGTKAVYLFYYLGYAAQPVCGPLDTAFTGITTNHRLRGVTHLVAKLLYNTDTEKIWQQGAPRDIKAVIKGKLIYDPRADSTMVVDDTTSPLSYGTGAQRYTDSTTWAWSDNPALCIADYLTNVMNVDPATEIDWVAIANAADHCDALVIVPPAASPSNYEKRFTCNGVLSMGDSHKKNIEYLLSSMDGRLVYSGGVWILRSSQWEASSVSLTADDLAGPVEIRGSAPKRERFNAVRGFFIDPDRLYQSVEFPHCKNTTYKTRDNNEEIYYDMKLPMTNSSTMAQRIAFRQLEQGDNQIIATLTLNAVGAKIKVGDVVDLTFTDYSWNAKTFRCIEWSANTDLTYKVVLREDASASYDDPDISDYLTGNNSDITPPSSVVPAPSALTAASRPYAIQLSWTNPPLYEFDLIDVYASSSSAWSGASRVASVRGDTYTHNIGSGETRWYWVRARRLSGELSNRFPNSDTSTVTSTAGAGTDSVNLTGASLTDTTYSDAMAGYRLTSAGAEESLEGAPDSPPGWDAVSTWLLAGAASNYEVRLSKNSGTDPTSGTLATWQALSSTRTWIWQDTTAGDGVTSFSGTVEIRDVSQSPAPVLASTTLNVSIEKEGEVVSLSGTTGVPNTAEAYDTAPATATTTWTFNSDGTVDRNGVQFHSATEWVIPNSPSATYYIRATKYGTGDNPDTGLTLGTWYALTSNRSWSWTAVSTKDGTLKIDIATAASPPAIVATGYYRGYAEVFPPE